MHQKYITKKKKDNEEYKQRNRDKQKEHMKKIKNILQQELEQINDAFKSFNNLKNYMN